MAIAGGSGDDSAKMLLGHCESRSLVQRSWTSGGFRIIPGKYESTSQAASTATLVGKDKKTNREKPVKEGLAQ